MSAETKEPLSDYVCSDCGTQLYVGHDCHKCGGFGADTPEQWAAGQAVRDSKKMAGKYDDVLRPFMAMMEAELHANCGKGDRPGWLQMTPQTALLEIYYHVSKLQKAVKNNGHDAIREYSADVANMAMMLLDVCVGIQPLATPSPAQAEPTWSDFRNGDKTAPTPAYAPTGAAEGAEPTDAERLDFLDAMGAGWIARHSVTGRGYRLHQDRDGPHPTARAAIDAAIRAAQKG